MVRTRDGVPYDDYEVSSRGGIRRRTASFRSPAGYQLRQILEPGGYLSVNLARDGRLKHFRVHDLVCSSFYGPPPPLPRPVVRHLDGSKLNNAAYNLRWGTPKENSEDARLHGQIARGNSHGRPRAKLSLAQTATIRAVAGQVRSSELALAYGVSQQNICNILKGRNAPWVVAERLSDPAGTVRAVKRAAGRARIARR